MRFSLQLCTEGVAWIYGFITNLMGGMTVAITCPVIPVRSGREDSPIPQFMVYSLNGRNCINPITFGHHRSGGITWRALRQRRATRSRGKGQLLLAVASTSQASSFLARTTFLPLRRVFKVMNTSISFALQQYTILGIVFPCRQCWDLWQQEFGTLYCARSEKYGFDFDFSTPWTIRYEFQ